MNDRPKHEDFCLVQYTKDMIEENNREGHLSMPRLLSSNNKIEKFEQSESTSYARDEQLENKRRNLEWEEEEEERGKEEEEVPLAHNNKKG